MHEKICKDLIILWQILFSQDVVTYTFLWHSQIKSHLFQNIPEHWILILILVVLKTNNRWLSNLSFVKLLKFCAVLIVFSKQIPRNDFIDVFYWNLTKYQCSVAHEETRCKCATETRYADATVSTSLFSELDSLRGTRATIYPPFKKLEQTGLNYKRNRRCPQTGWLSIAFVAGNEVFPHSKGLPGGVGIFNHTDIRISARENVIEAKAFFCWFNVLHIR